MYSDRFNKFIPFILEWECVFKKGHYNDYNYIAIENVKGDPGGPTFAGIDKSSHPHFDFTHPTLEKAKDVYWEEWQNEGIEAMEEGLGEAYYNCCVNAGIGRAKKIVLTTKTSKEFIDAQEQFYRRLAASRPSLKKFLNGWINRLTSLRKYLNIG
jgi:lysozyme family protein